MILDINNNILSFGENEFGQLGMGNNIDIPTKINNIKGDNISACQNHSLLVDMDNNLWGFGDT